MPLQRLLQLERARLPDVDGLVLRRSRDQLVVGGHSDSINVFLMRHDCHLGRVYHLVGLLGCFNHIPHFQGVVLTDRCEKLVLLGRETNTRDVLVVTKEGCQASNLLLERLSGVKGPHFYRVVLRAREENRLFFTVFATLVDDIKTEDDVCMARVQLNIIRLHIE